MTLTLWPRLLSSSMTGTLIVKCEPPKLAKQALKPKDVPMSRKKRARPIVVCLQFIIHPFGDFSAEFLCEEDACCMASARHFDVRAVSNVFMQLFDPTNRHQVVRFSRNNEARRRDCGCHDIVVKVCHQLEMLAHHIRIVSATKKEKRNKQKLKQSPSFLTLPSCSELVVLACKTR